MADVCFRVRSGRLDPFGKVFLEPRAELAAIALSLQNGPPDLKQAYTRLAVREVCVKDEEIRFIGSKAVLARAAAQGLRKTPPQVLSFVQEWRARKDSNL